MLSGEQQLLTGWTKQKNQPKKKWIKGPLLDGKISTCITIPTAVKDLIPYVKFRVIESVVRNNKIQFQVAVKGYTSCSNVTFLNTIIKVNGHNDANDVIHHVPQSCYTEEMYIRCKAIGDHLWMNSFCTLECQCPMEGAKCDVMVLSDPMGEEFGQFCELRIV